MRTRKRFSGLVPALALVAVAAVAPAAQAFDTFTPTGSLTDARYYATSTLLSSGKVLVVGGYGGSLDANLASSEIYNPATGRFTPTGRLAIARQQATATRLANGKVLIVGGAVPGAVLASAELYNPATGLFTTTGSLSAARTSATSTLLPNGKVLIAGGANSREALRLASAELYNPIPAKPAKPVVRWALNKRKRLVTATVNRVSGVSYKLTAKRGRSTKSGRCRSAARSKVVCTLAPGTGRWVFSLTPKNPGGSGRANTKAIKL